jgi:hypothetical protein
VGQWLSFFGEGPQLNMPQTWKGKEIDREMRIIII